MIPGLEPIQKDLEKLFLLPDDGNSGNSREKTEKLEFKKEYSTKNENIYGSKTSTWFGIGGYYATVLYNYIITVSSAKGGMRITPSVYIAYPHKADEEPKFNTSPEVKKKKKGWF